MEKKHDVIHKTGRTQRIATKKQEDGRATSIGNMHKNLIKIARIAPKISSRTDRHTDTQADAHTCRRTNHNTSQ